MRYLLAVGAFALLIAITFVIPRILPVSLDLTSLIIITMIAAAWYLGRGPGLLFAVIFEATLVYFAYAAKHEFSFNSALITFNRLILFGSVVLFASSRRNAEKNLRDQQKLLQVTLESIGDSVIATDIEGRINFINPTAEKMTGWTIADAAGRLLEEVFHIVNEETREPVESPFTIIKSKGVTVGLANHTTLITKDGREIPIEDSGAPIKDDDGAVIGAILVFHDVSERRAAEKERERLFQSEQSARGEAESANRLKDEFLTTVSHELRTPLNAILGWASMLNRGNLKEENTRNALEIIERNAKAQAEIIGDILDVSRIITGKLQIESKTIELTRVIRASIDTLRPAADAKSISLSILLDENTGLIVGDADRLQQIIWNLVSNAIKFTTAGGNVEVRLQQVDANAEISVTDSGIGISPKFLPFVFERFRQADSSTTRLDSGLGLGLAIVRHLVELHGGTVRAESEGEGKGATFIIKLPLTAAAGESVTTADILLASHNSPGETRGIAAAPDLSGLRVLLVDDDPDSLEVLHLMLAQYGAEVRTANSSAAALDTFLEWTPNVLVSDIGMPNEDGYSLIGKIRNLTPEKGGNVPAAALTAYVRERDKREAIAAGFQAHIAKPVEQEMLAEAVAKLARQAGRN
ncbi:MAG TPA: ATP-binding protein [Pyrinomonadaceae bacterium]